MDVLELFYFHFDHLFCILYVFCRMGVYIGKVPRILVRILFPENALPEVPRCVVLITTMIMCFILCSYGDIIISQCDMLYYITYIDRKYLMLGNIDGHFHASR